MAAAATHCCLASLASLLGDERVLLVGISAGSVDELLLDNAGPLTAVTAVIVSTPTNAMHDHTL
jgi:ABC-type transport system involved in cytochrome c biogenesis permease component